MYMYVSFLTMFINFIFFLLQGNNLQISILETESDGLTINIITIQICMSRYQACSQGDFIGFGRTPLLETNGEIIKHVSACAYTVHACTCAHTGISRICS